MSAIGIILNPNSKLNRQNPKRVNLLRHISKDKCILKITKSVEDITPALTELKSNNISILAIDGGDGSISCTLSALIHLYKGKDIPKILVLKGGTMNVLSSEIGNKGDFSTIIPLLLEYIDKNRDIRTISRKTLKIEDRYGFIYADGTSAQYLKKFYENKGGSLAASMLTLKIAISSLTDKKLFHEIVRCEPMKIKPYPHPSISCRPTGLFATTIAKFPMGIPVFKKTKDNNKFQTVIITSPPKMLLWHLPYIIFQKESTSRGKQQLSCTRLDIEADEKFTYTLDGELYETKDKTLEINTGPNIEFVTI